MRDKFDREFDDVEFVSNNELARETGNAKRAEGVRRPDTRKKISKSNKESYQNTNRLEKQKVAMQNRDNSSHKAAGEKRKNSKEWKENHAAGLEALRNDPVRWAEYRENYTKGNTAKYDDPAFWESYYAAIKIRDANPEYQKKRLGASKEKIRKPVQTPLGVFETQTDAANAHGFSNTEKLRHRIKSPNPKFAEYKSLTIEEYEQLKKP